MSRNPILIQHALNAGEVSARFEARQDQNKYQAALRQSLNWWPLTVGGVFRRPGLKFINIAKTRGAIVRTFRFSNEQSYILEFGEFYIRFYKDGALLGEGAGAAVDTADKRAASMLYGMPFGPLPMPDGSIDPGNRADLTYLYGATLIQEVVTPYLQADLYEVFTHQSADIMYFTHRRYPVHKLSRLDDSPDTFTFTEVHFDAPATIEEEPTGADLGIGTLTPSATTGDGVLFTGENSGFLDADVGRIVVYGASRGEIVAQGGNTITVDIIDDFPDTSPIPATDWRLVLSPRTDLDITNRKKDVGEVATLTADDPAFRSFDVGKWITIFGGLVKITKVTDSTHVRVVIKTTLHDITVNNPDKTPAWTLEVEAWTATRGYPSCGCFFQERHYLCKGLTINGSVVNDFENFAKGGGEDDAIARTISDDEVNPILWIKGLSTLQIGTGNSAYQVTATTTSGALTQSSFKVAPVSSRGAARVQPLRIGGLILYLQFGQRKLRELVFDFVTDKFKSPNLFQLAEHLVDGFYVIDLAFAQEPDSIVYAVRNDGKMLALTYQEDEQVIGWSPTTTDGDGFLSVAVIPRPSTGKDWVWVSVDRVTQVRSVSATQRASVINHGLPFGRLLPVADGDVESQDKVQELYLYNFSLNFADGATKTYIECFEPDETDTGREWHDLQTDSALVLTHDVNFGVTGLDHLEGKTVRVIGDGMLFEDQVVVNGAIMLDPQIPVSKVEIGLDYESDGLTLRPVVPPELGGPLIAKGWKELGVFIRRALGLKLGREGQEGEQLVYRKPYHLMDAHVPLQEGYKCIMELGNDPFSRVRFRQTLPFPAEVLNILGWLHVGDDWECDTVDEAPVFVIQEVVVPPTPPPLEPPACTDATIRGQSQHSFTIELAFDITSTEPPLTSIRESWGYIHNGELYALVGNSVCGGGNMWYENTCCQIAHFKDDDPDVFEILPLPIQIHEAFFNARFGTSDEPVWASASGLQVGLRVVYDLGNRILDYVTILAPNIFSILEGSIWIWGGVNGHVYEFTTTSTTLLNEYDINRGGPYPNDLESMLSISLTSDKLICLSNGSYFGLLPAIIFVNRADGTIDKVITIKNLDVGSMAVINNDLIYLLTAGPHPVLYYCDGTDINYIGYCTNTDAPTIGPAWFDNGTFYFNKGYDVWKILVDCPPDGGPTPPTISTDATTVAAGDTVNVTWSNLLVAAAEDEILLNPYQGAGDPISFPGSGGASTAFKIIGPAVSGTTTFTIPLSAPAGDYVFQLSPKFLLWAANSNVFTVT